MIGCSVVIPTHDRRASLLRTLEALGRQTYPASATEVIVVCDGCSDGSAEAARRLAVRYRLIVVEQAGQGPAAARNRALELAEGELAVFIDDDVVPARGWLEKHARAHARESSLAAIGPLLPPPGWGPPWVRWEMQTVKRQYELMAAGDFRPGPRQFYTGNASVRLGDLRAAGGFDAGFQRGEDVELAFRLQSRGLRFAFIPEAEALHLADRSFASWVAAARHYGRNEVLLGRRGRSDMLLALAREFHERRRANRIAVRAALSLPARVRPPLAAARLAALAAQRLGADAAAHAICSAVFGVEYWRGVAEALGGPGVARSLIASARGADSTPA